MKMVIYVITCLGGLFLLSRGLFLPGLIFLCLGVYMSFRK